MLEIKNVTKIYKTKGGVETKALDDVSISFGETGLVFLLGKSGSGKSTLLNVSGGLDEPTSGEVIVKGKSSKSFSGSDFDSYRNTFVGFVFQEYNVLNEFNVEDNIALALELQGKPKNKEKIHELLRDVELEKFAKRKPNTLSGGQKQRIAIARALIKDPQIIMADEPTGALDSATGKQVFDTLKHLSKTRLVIVVSHDREFAEIYGDRIVELKDGKIISDVSKTSVPPEHIDENVSIIGGNTISIKSGSTLTKANIKTIQDFILKTDGDVLISKGEQEISSFKKVNRLADDGAAEKFGDTKQEDLALKQYTPEESKFIRSRLPAAKAIKIGASGLKLKPVRLIFTIFLSFLAFTMFGLLSTLMVYDGDKVASTSFANSDYEFLNITKYYRTYVTNNEYGYSYDFDREVELTDVELNKLKSDHGAETFGYFTHDSYSGDEVENLKLKTENNANGGNALYKTRIKKYAYLPASHKLRGNLKGGYPAAADEICISSYLFDVIKNSEFYNVTVKNGVAQSYGSDDKVTVNSENDIIGKYIVLNLNNKIPLKVTGVFESGSVPDKYNGLKDNPNDYMLSYYFDSYLDESMHQTAFVSENFYEEYGGNFVRNYNSGADYFDYIQGGGIEYYQDRYYYENGEWKEETTDNTMYLGSEVSSLGGKYQYETMFFDGRQTQTLADDEMVVNIHSLTGINALDGYIQKYYMERIEAGDYDDEYPNHDFSDDYEVENVSNDLRWRFRQKIYRYNEDGYQPDGYWDEDAGETVYPEYVKFTKEEKQALQKEVRDTLCDIFDYIELRLDVSGMQHSVKVVGVYFADGNTYSSGVYLSQNFIDSNLEVAKDTSVQQTNYEKEEGAIYTGAYVAFDRSEGAFNKIMKLVGEENILENDVFYTLNNSLYDSVERANGIVELLSTVFLWVGIGFAVFSALLLFNFISVSISNKKKEIGILRAVGARGTDVFKIFFAESGIIVGICTVLALIGTFVTCTLINGILKTELGLDVTLFVFGFASVGMLIGIALLVAFISTFLPVFFAARKKPVDSIRAL